MNWIILTILAITSRAAYSVGTRLVGRDLPVSPITQSFLLSFTSGLIALCCIPLLGGVNFDAVSLHLLPIILIIASSVAGNIIYFKGQKQLDAGTTQVVFSSILIWGAILSVLFLSSDFSARQIAGMGVMLGALILVQYRKKSLKPDPNAIYILISAMMFAILQVASAGVSKSLTTSTYLLLSFFGTAVTIGLLYFRRVRNDLRTIMPQMSRMLLKVFFTAGTSLLYFVFSFLAYRSAPDRGVVVVLLTAQAVLSVIFGIIFLGEKERYGKKLAAGALAFLAGFLINS